MASLTTKAPINVNQYCTLRSRAPLSFFNNHRCKISAQNTLSIFHTAHGKSWKLIHQCICLARPMRSTADSAVGRFSEHCSGSANYPGILLLIE